MEKIEVDAKLLKWLLNDWMDLSVESYHLEPAPTELSEFVDETVRRLNDES